MRPGGISDAEVFFDCGPGGEHHPAAALLHLTQPTLSRQLMQLEEELGVKLFRRSQHHIVLTEAGMLLRRRAQEIVELAEKTARELRPAEEVTGRISIGSGDLRSMTYLAKLLAAFHRQHPRVQYEIYSGDSDGIKERIEQGLLDMGLLLEPVDTSRYQILRLPSGNPGASWCRRIRPWPGGRR